MNYTEALNKLNSIEQGHLLKFWNDLTTSQKDHLLSEIKTLNVSEFKQQRTLFLNDHSPKQPFASDPLPKVFFNGNLQDIEQGKQQVAEGSVGCLIVAGGQGTRLGTDQPKGFFPVSLIKQKSLFQIFAEKVVAAGKLAGRLLPLAIMTSPYNDTATRLFLKEHSWFGLQKEQVDFFCQSTLPFLDENGNLFLAGPDQIAQGPDGNGSSLFHFWDAGIGPKWLKQGVKSLNFVLIDNPLADPFDSELIGFHHRLNNEITIKSILRENVKEKVGILVKNDRKIQVVEYSEMDENEQCATAQNGKLKYPCANISLFCISLEWLNRFISSRTQLPLHLMHKTTKVLQINNHQLQHSIEMAWKFERFIFDILPHANKVEVLIVPREYCFAPLKSLDGEGCLTSVQAALQKRDREVFKQVTGEGPPLQPFELSQEFYYPTEQLIKKWHGKPAPDTPYINA